MVASNFSASLKRLLVHEGGVSDHPNDPGGLTKWGVTQRVYSGWRSNKGLPDRKVTSVNLDEVTAIYRSQYADAIRFDVLPVGLDYVVFDGAVNSGPRQSGKWLQWALQRLGFYTGKIDGVIGNATLAAVQLVEDVDALIARICDRRLAFMKALKTWKSFGRGWTARVEQVGDAGQDWAAGSVPADSNLTYVKGMEARAFVSDAALPKAPVTTATAGAAAGTVAGFSETVRQAVDGARDQVSQFAGVSQFVDNALVVLTAVSLAAGLAGVVYGFWASRKARRIEAVLDLDTDAAPAT